MEIYEMVEMVPSITKEPSFWVDDSPSIEPDLRAALELPAMFCQICNGRWVPLPLPEGEQFRQSPLFKKLRRIRDEKRKIHNRIEDELVDLKNKTLGALPKDHPIWRRLDEEPAISPGEFQYFTNELRSLLRLPHSRPIYPKSRIVQKSLIYNGGKFPPIFFNSTPASEIFITTDRINELEKQRLTGWIHYPVTVRHRRRSSIDALPMIGEMIVVGSAGLASQASSQVPYEHCPNCSLPILGSFPECPTLDKSQWDGTDIFRFKGSPKVYVTDKAKRAMEEVLMTGIAFRPCTIRYDEWRRTVGPPIISADIESVLQGIVGPREF